ncbi:MAG: DUF2911 domain-containing protein [Ginsengibacter sp.]
MKRILLSAALFSFLGTANSQVKLPAPSPTQTIKQDFGMSSVELTYSRPSLKGRKIIGDLEPYNVVWRTGANAATHIRFNDPVEIMGTKVDTGNYVIYTIPSKDNNWTFILNRGINNWGVDGYKQTEDVLRAKIKAEIISQKIETLTMQFGSVRPESMDLLIRWENTSLKIPITTNIKERLRAQINAAMQTDKQPYWAAAQFYSEYDNDKAKALEMITKAIDQNAASKPFYMIYYKAKIQKDMGDFAGARSTAAQSIAMAKEAKNDNYVLMNEKLLKEMK